MKIIKKIITLILISNMIILATAGCGDSPKTVTNPAVTYPADVKTAEEVIRGKMGKIKMVVAVRDNKIFDVRILENSETPSHASKALEQVPKEIVEKQSLEVDVISGATVTSKAIVDGVEKALKKLGIDTSELK